MENFILKNVGLELTFVSTMDKNDILPMNAEIQGRKIALQYDNLEEMPEPIV